VRRALPAAIVAAIVYGSLYPFSLAPNPLGVVGALLHSLHLRPDRGDVVANLGLYFPLGLFLPLPPALKFLAGTALSTGIECAQVFIPARTPSVWDIGLNAAGTLLGVLAARHAPRIASRLGRPAVDRAALFIALLWPAARLVPFVPALDWQKWKHAIRPLLVAAPAPLDAFIHGTMWLVFAAAAERAVGRNVLLPAFIAVQAGRIIVENRVLSSAELLGGAAAILLRRFLKHPPVLALLLTIAVLCVELEPFRFAFSRPFNWTPFFGLLRGSIEINLIALLEKAYAYGALVWLLTLCRVRLLAAGTGVAVVLLVLELAQTRLPGRVPEITDSLIALGMAVAVAALTRVPERRSGSRDAVPLATRAR
jgi:VanZ family protein